MCVGDLMETAENDLYSVESDIAPKRLVHFAMCTLPGSLGSLQEDL